MRGGGERDFQFLCSASINKAIQCRQPVCGAGRPDERRGLRRRYVRRMRENSGNALIFCLSVPVGSFCQESSVKVTFDPEGLPGCFPTHQLATSRELIPAKSVVATTIGHWSTCFPIFIDVCYILIQPKACCFCSQLATGRSLCGLFPIFMHICYIDLSLQQTVFLSIIVQQFSSLRQLNPLYYGGNSPCNRIWHVDWRCRL